MNQRAFEMRVQLGVELEHIFWYYDGDGGDNEQLRNHMAAIKAAKKRISDWETQTGINAEELCKNRERVEEDIRRLQSRIKIVDRKTRKELKEQLKAAEMHKLNLDRLYNQQGPVLDAALEELKRLRNAPSDIEENAMKAYFEDFVKEHTNYSVIDEKTVTFGSYDQGKGYKEPVRWKLYKREHAKPCYYTYYDGGFYLVSEKALEVAPSFKDDIYFNNWLRTVFFDELFNDYEKMFLDHGRICVPSVSDIAFAWETWPESCFPTAYLAQKAGIPTDKECSHVIHCETDFGTSNTVSLAGRREHASDAEKEVWSSDKMKYVEPCITHNNGGRAFIRPMIHLSLEWSTNKKWSSRSWDDFKKLIYGENREVTEPGYEKVDYDYNGKYVSQVIHQKYGSMEGFHHAMEIREREKAEYDKKKAEILAANIITEPPVVPAAIPSASSQPVETIAEPDYTLAEETPVEPDYTLAEETPVEPDYTLAEEPVANGDYTLAEEVPAEPDYTLAEETPSKSGYTSPTRFTQEELNGLGNTIEEVDSKLNGFYFSDRGIAYVRKAQIYEAQGNYASAYKCLNLAINLHGLTDYAAKRDELRAHFTPEEFGNYLRNLYRGGRS